MDGFRKGAFRGGRGESHQLVPIGTLAAGGNDEITVVIFGGSADAKTTAAMCKKG